MRKATLSLSEMISRYNAGDTFAAIAAAANVSPPAIRMRLMKSGIRLRTQEENAPRRRKYDYAQVIADYLSGMTLKEVGQKHGTNESGVHQIVRGAGIPTRTKMEACRRGITHPNWKGGQSHDKDGYLVTAEGKLHRLEMSTLVGRDLEKWEHVHHVNGNKRDAAARNLVIMPAREHNRFHVYLRQRDLAITREIMEAVCVKEDDTYYRFTRKMFLLAKANHPTAGISILPLKKKAICSIKDCGRKVYGHRLCSRHYQRKRAFLKGHWKCGDGRIANFKGEWND